jgi:hypothetical protein
MLYAIYNHDGSIQQCNKLYSAENGKYEKQLNDMGHKWLSVENAPGLLPPERWYVDVKSEDLCERPLMQAVAFASVIKAGGDALITGIPKGASVTVMAAGETIYSVPALDGDELQFSIPLPCKYRTVIRKWPFQDCNIDIEAVTA